MKNPFRKRTVDSIVGPLSKIIADLEAHITSQGRFASRKELRINKLQVEVYSHLAEADRASSARDKIAALIG